MDTHQYVLKYVIAGEDEQHSFKIDSNSLEDAVDNLVKKFGDGFNAADIEFVKIEEDCVDLEEDGILRAEQALQKYYN